MAKTDTGINSIDSPHVEGHPYEVVGKRVPVWPVATNIDENARVTQNLDFASAGETENIVGTSTGPHKAAYVLGKNRPD